MTLGEIIENVCELCAAEGYPYNEETCKDCEYNPNNKHETTTFERIDGLHQMYNVFHKCTKCGRYVHFPTTLAEDRKIDFNYCPYCGRPVAKE